MDERSARLTERIAFAEGWLDRARRQIQDGQVSRGALTMLLAEAELQRARDAGWRDAAASRSPGRPWTAWMAIAALVVAAATALTVSLARVNPGAAGEGPTPTIPIVKLSGGSGEMLRLVTVPEPVVERTVVERTVVKSRIVRVPVPEAAPAQPAPPPEITLPAPAPAPVRVPPPAVRQAPPAPAAVAAAPAPPTLLTDVEVIDMVLAAERSLRRAGNP